MAIQILWLVGGLALLVYGADRLVRGAARLAEAAGLPRLVVGLTVVSFGTSAPELSVAVGSALSGHTDLALGGAVGSNICNILLILGVCAVSAPLLVARTIVRRDVPIAAAVTVIVWLLAANGAISRGAGAALIGLFVAYTAYLVVSGRKAERERRGSAPRLEDATGPLPLSTGKAAFFTALGLALLAVGAHFLVQGATGLARAVGLSELAIGLIVVAVGTSAPELAASLMAAAKGERDLAVGNVIGSNIFNLTAALGAAALFSPTGAAVPPEVLRFDLPVALCATLLCLPIFITGSRVSRSEGVLFLGYYVLYTALVYLGAMDHRLAPFLSRAALWGVVPAAGIVFLVSIMRTERRLDRYFDPLARALGENAAKTMRRARKGIVLLSGATVVALGAAMVLLPGPGMLVIIGGLVILATEFVWAKSLLIKVERMMRDVARVLEQKTRRKPGGGAEPMP